MNATTNFFLGGGIGLLVLSALLGIAVYCSMMIGIIPFAGPPKFLWILLLLAVAMSIVGMGLALLRLLLDK